MRHGDRWLDDRDYERHLAECIRRRVRPDRPQSREQWLLALRYFPSLGDLWEVPDLVEPWDDHEQERFLATLVQDDQFRRAVVAALKGGPR